MKLSDYLDIDPETPQLETAHAVNAVRQGFQRHVNRSLDSRRQHLRDLYYALDDNRDMLAEAFSKDRMRRNVYETHMEISLTLGCIASAITNLDTWAADEHVPFALTTFLSRPRVRKTPLGTVLIIVPWNFPIILGLAPLTDALAAGNTAIVKLSEASPHISRCLCKVLRSVNPHCVNCVLGSVPQVSYLLNQEKWDLIFFTGGAKVGSLVAAAAAKSLTPYVLELGGKSPVIITRATRNLACAAKRIAWSKVFNSGQICVSVDYVLIDKSLESQFVQHYTKALIEFGLDLSGGARVPDHVTRIVNSASFDRIKSALDKTNGHVVLGGSADRPSLYIEPTLVTGVSVDDSLMQQEIFGPVLPVISFTQLQSAIDIVNTPGLATPLTLYIVSDSPAEQELIMGSVRSGSVMVNDFVFQASSYNLPFGGVGSSGVGLYHGQKGFDQFSQQRTVCRQPFLAELFLRGRYPPLNKTKIKMISRLGPVPVSWMPRSGPVRVPLSLRLVFTLTSPSLLFKCLLVVVSFYLGARFGLHQ